MIAARLGRTDEARRLVAPVVELQRGLFGRSDNEDLTQRIEFAQALLASALSDATRRTADLKQAAVLVDSVPAEMRRMISVSRLRAEIGAEMAAQRPGT